MWDACRHYLIVCKWWAKSLIFTDCVCVWSAHFTKRALLLKEKSSYESTIVLLSSSFSWL
jgi:hypothetical protein